ncbi:D-alanyl-D-alanine carboxypeptidase family protein [Streptomyces doudnae]|uniref:Serine hydrolase n=3 Tax=Streptomyces TaxID=1883 RepID=A0ABD5EKC8_9ACTN|nr:serine hydrolase [Streptomyces sp. DSM 41981]MDT0435106.1 serine hydrolase [Streptomyces sp. DSM 41981]
MHETSPLTRRAALGMAAAVIPFAAAPAHAATAVGGARLARDGVQGGGPPGKLSAAAWLVADHDSGEVLAAYRAHHALAPASTLKMLFAATVLTKFAATERHTVTDADLADVPAGSSLVGVKAGLTYTVEQLWQGVFLRSGNDAVHVLARMNGGIERTVAEMQALADDLQARDTRVVSPDGFDHPGQLSSAYDLTLFARHGLRDAHFRAYCATRGADFPAGGGRTFRIQNTDRLLTGELGVAPYQGLIGVKNGYTSDAGNTFTGAATRDGRTLLATVMHPRSGYNAVYEETAALLDWGFGRSSAANPVGVLVPPLSEGGVKAETGAAVGEGAPGRAARGESGGRSPWGVLEGAGGAIAVLAGGAWALRRRRPGAAARD